MSKPVATPISNRNTVPVSRSGSQGRSLKVAAEDIWRNRTEKVNAELFAVTYGAIVSQLCLDFGDDYEKVNQHLYAMGRTIGERLIDDFIARTGLPRCENMIRTSEVLSKCAFKVFLNITPQVANWSVNRDQFSLILDHNPLSEFVELPQNAMRSLWYSNLLTGVLKGALEMVQMDCDVTFVSDVLRGDPQTEIKIKLNRILRDEIPIGED